MLKIQIKNKQNQVTHGAQFESQAQVEAWIAECEANGFAKLIPGYENYLALKDGRIFSLLTNKFLSYSKDKDGYLQVGLRKNKKGNTKKVHRLIAQTFLSNDENLPEVNHINEIKNDNRIENLEWVTPKQNTQHSLLSAIPKKNKKLTDEQVNTIKQMRKNGTMPKELSKIFGVTKTYICDVIAGRERKYVQC